MTAPPLRSAAPEDYAPLADLWAERWADAHGAYSPPELIALRTRADFLRRLRAFGPGLRVLGPPGAPEGFCAIRADHLDQLYVSRALAGTGAARRLMAHALARIYARSGWRRRGTDLSPVETAAGPFLLRVIVFEKALATDP